MKLPNYKRIDKQDFDQQYQDLIDILSQSLNNDISAVFDALNKKLSLRDNFLCNVKDIQVIVDSNGIPQNKTGFQVDSSTTRIIGCEVLRAINVRDSNTYPVSAPFISFGQSGNFITINHITGLQTNQLYNLTILAWGS